MPGNNIDARTNSLWMKIVDWYNDNDVQDRLPKLLPTWIQSSADNPPKLKGNASTTRALIPFMYEAAEELLDTSDPIENAMQVAAFHLLECYRCLSNDELNWRTILPASSTSFVLQYKALADHHGDVNWRCKPKLHHFLELCSGTSKPNLSWTYRDEDYGGTVAKLAHSRGGSTNPKVVSAKTLLRFKQQNAVPRLVWTNWRAWLPTAEPEPEAKSRRARMHEMWLIQWSHIGPNIKMCPWTLRGKSRRRQYGCRKASRQKRRASRKPTGSNVI